MARFAVSIVVVICLVSVAYGMDCTLGTSDNFIDKFVNSCPRPLIDPSENSYCCPRVDGTVYCCDWAEFTMRTGLGIIVPVVIAVVVIISLIVFCISCLCCACCPWYRRRHRGTIYSSMQTPVTGIHVIQTPPSNSGYTVHQIQQIQPPIYANAVSAMPQHPVPPPQYTREDNTKQAPYNPSYVQ
ncbi:protein shisa-5 isoform X1 [Neodiprion pinetum]|uniref:protein shisa-5 isoform X1 n=1 Tax=Neodiprion pinetum TaxID=441929 RepID=UPI001EDFFDEF|nr:protein shisa-4-like isoform X1 [Neodiprion pinetum]